MDAWESDLITDEAIDTCVERLMEARLRLGMFADDCKYDEIPYSIIECEKHRALNRKMAQDSIVLLKNNGILPLKKEQKVAVIGPNSDSKAVLLGNYNGTPSKYYTFLRGIQQYTDPTFAEGCHLYLEKMPDRGLTVRSAIVAANNADVIVMFMGIDPSMEGEQGDRYNVDASGDKVTLDLPVSQRILYEELKKLGKPIVFVNVSGSCMNLKDQKENCDAVIQCFYPGAEGGLALADVLYGTVSPSGRLPVTFYESLGDLPAFEDYSMENRTYKFYQGTPVFEFGYGLTYSEIEENWLNENTVKLTNKGEFDTAYSVLKFEYIPHKNLCGFKKVFLRKGESMTVIFDGKDE
jgi:beta-glucosidase